jgi:hypothetical protein
LSTGVLVPQIDHSGQQRCGIIRVRAFLSLKSSSSGQQCLCIIRVRALVPRIVLFGLATPSYYSSAGVIVPRIASLGQQCLGIIRVRALLSLESLSSGQQRLHILRVRASVPRIAFFGPVAPQLRFGSGFSPLNPILYSCIHSKCPSLGGNIPVRMPYVKYEGKCTVCNTRWPGIHIKRALPRNFPYLWYEVCTDGCIGCLTMNWASTW